MQPILPPQPRLATDWQETPRLRLSRGAARERRLQRERGDGVRSRSRGRAEGEPVRLVRGAAAAAGGRRGRRSDVHDRPQVSLFSPLAERRRRHEQEQRHAHVEEQVQPSPSPPSSAPSQPVAQPRGESIRLHRLVTEDAYYTASAVHELELERMIEEDIDRDLEMEREIEQQLRQERQGRRRELQLQREREASSVALESSQYSRSRGRTPSRQGRPTLESTLQCVTSSERYTPDDVDDDASSVASSMVSIDAPADRSRSAELGHRSRNRRRRRTKYMGASEALTRGLSGTQSIARDKPFASRAELLHAAREHRRRFSRRKHAPADATGDDSKHKFRGSYTRYPELDERMKDDRAERQYITSLLEAVDPLRVDHGVSSSFTLTGMLSSAIQVRGGPLAAVNLAKGSSEAEKELDKYREQLRRSNGGQAIDSRETDELRRARQYQVERGRVPAFFNTESTEALLRANPDLRRDFEYEEAEEQPLVPSTIRTVGYAAKRASLSSTTTIDTSTTSTSSSPKKRNRNRMSKTSVTSDPTATFVTGIDLGSVESKPVRPPREVVNIEEIESVDMAVVNLPLELLSSEHVHPPPPSVRVQSTMQVASDRVALTRRQRRVLWDPYYHSSSSRHVLFDAYWYALIDTFSHLPADRLAKERTAQEHSRRKQTRRASVTSGTSHGPGAHLLETDADHDARVVEERYEFGKIRERLLSRLGASYVELFMNVKQQHRDEFFARYYDAVAQFIYYAFNAAYPSSSVLLDDVKVRERLLRMTAEWTIGFVPALASPHHWIDVHDGKPHRQVMLKHQKKSKSSSLTARLEKVLTDSRSKNPLALPRSQRQSQNAQSDKGDDDGDEDKVGSQASSRAGSAAPPAGSASADGEHIDEAKSITDNMRAAEQAETMERAAEAKLRREIVPLKVEREVVVFNHSKLVQRFLDDRGLSTHVDTSLRMPLTGTRAVDTPLTKRLLSMHKRARTLENESSRKFGAYEHTKDSYRREVNRLRRHVHENNQGYEAHRLRALRALYSKNTVAQ